MEVTLPQPVLAPSNSPVCSQTHNSFVKETGSALCTAYIGVLYKNCLAFFLKNMGGKNIWFEKLKRFRLYTVSIHLLLPCTFLLLLCSAMTDCRQLGLFIYLMTFPIVQMYWKQRQTVNVSLLIFRMIQQSK